MKCDVSYQRGKIVFTPDTGRIIDVTIDGAGANLVHVGTKKELKRILAYDISIKELANNPFLGDYEHQHLPPLDLIIQDFCPTQTASGAELRIFNPASQKTILSYDKKQEKYSLVILNLDDTVQNRCSTNYDNLSWASDSEHLKNALENVRGIFNHFVKEDSK